MPWDGKHHTPVVGVWHHDRVISRKERLIENQMNSLTRRNQRRGDAEGCLHHLQHIPGPFGVERKMTGGEQACVLLVLCPEPREDPVRCNMLGRTEPVESDELVSRRLNVGRGDGMCRDQAIQHPLAKNWIDLEAAWLMTVSAAWQYDQGLPCGPVANAAKYLAGEAGFDACQQAVMTHGGFGYAKEYHVERYLREVMIPRIAPISPQLILSFIGEKVLGLPKSY